VNTKFYTVGGGRVVRCRTCDREVAGSNPTLGCCVPTPTQHAIPPGSVNEYQRKLGSKRAYHAIHWPRIRGLAASAGVRLRANETEISAAPWALMLMKGLYFFYLSYTIITFKSPVSPFPWKIPLRMCRLNDFIKFNTVHIVEYLCMHA